VHDVVFLLGQQVALEVVRGCVFGGDLLHLQLVRIHLREVLRLEEVDCERELVDREELSARVGLFGVVEFPGGVAGDHGEVVQLDSEGEGVAGVFVVLG